MPTLITSLMLIVLVWLGCWQVERLHWKNNILATIDQRIHLQPQELSVVLEEENDDYKPVTAIGLYQHDHEFFLNAISLVGEGGYDVLTPLLLKDGHAILVNRGWIPYSQKDPQTRRNGQLMGPVLVSGVLRRPQKGWLQPDNDIQGNVWYGIDLESMSKQAGGVAFIPYVLYANEAPKSDGLPIGGQLHVDLPNNHKVYALTWFGLAFSLLVLYGIQAYVKPPKG